MADPIPVAQISDGRTLALLPAIANRHGLITGATGTGKTVTLQVIAERFSRIGVPVFMADVKGDLAGLAAGDAMTPKLTARVADRPRSHGAGVGASPVTFWDVFGKPGHPVRATIRHGPAAAAPAAEPERHAARRADARLQDRRRQRACCCSI